MKLTNAKRYRIKDSFTGLPDVSDSVMAFLRPVKVDIICKEQIDGYTQESKRCVHTQAVKQPFTSEQLKLKPEGQRSWKWFTLHCLPNLILRTDDIAVISGSSFRVMERTDYREYGYLQYDLVEDYREND